MSLANVADTVAYTKRIGDIFGYNTHQTYKVSKTDKVEKFAMGYANTDTIKLNAIRFFARGIGDDRNARIKISKIKNGFPGGKYYTKDIVITQSSQLEQYDISIDEILVLTDTFFVSVEGKKGADVFELQFSLLGVGFFKHFGCLQHNKTWMTTESFYGAKDEPNIHLVIEYNVKPDFTVGGVSIPEGDTLDVNQGYPILMRNTTNVILNYMFSYRYIHPGDLYSWDFGDGTKDYQIAQSKTYDTIGVYKFTLIDTVETYSNEINVAKKSIYFNVKAPGKYSDAEETTTTEEEKVEKILVELEGSGHGVDIYPNPTEGNLNIDLSGIDDIEEDLMVKIYNYSGQLVKSELVNDQTLMSLDLSSLSSGLYTVTLLNDVWSNTQKIFIK